MIAGKSIRLLMLALLPATASLHAQNHTSYPSLPVAAPPTTPAANLPQAPQSTTLPATPSTAPIDTTSVPPSAPPAPVQSPAHRATVSYNDGQISVSASNSSLNQILRDISRQTGIKITGGVRDERVFGDYGPASPAQVLSTLLDGTGSNMLLVQGTDGRSSELVLTTRTGGPTPPNPNAQNNDPPDDDAPVRVIVNNPPEPPPPPPQGSQSQPSQPAVATPVPPQNADAGTPAPATTTNGDSNQQSPNGVKTPQQIFDELMKLRQQQQQQH